MDPQVDPVRPADLADPANSADPEDPADPANSADPEDPADPANSADPEDPADPANPADPGYPADPAEPVNPTNAANPADGRCFAPQKFKFFQPRKRCFARGKRRRAGQRTAKPPEHKPCALNPARRRGARLAAGQAAPALPSRRHRCRCCWSLPACGWGVQEEDPGGVGRIRDDPGGSGRIMEDPGGSGRIWGDPREV